MKKVVVNEAFAPCYLSADAIYLLFRLGYPMSVEPLAKTKLFEADFNREGPDGFLALSGEHSALLKDGQVYRAWLGRGTPEADALRSHPGLVRMAELLGKRATIGRFGRLKVQEIPDEALYCITEYDGAEGVKLFDPNEYILGQMYQEPLAPKVPPESWFSAEQQTEVD